MGSRWFPTTTRPARHFRTLGRAMQLKSKWGGHPFAYMSGRNGRRVTDATRLVIEHLESRVLLSTNSWIANSGGDWDTASNWSLGHMPTASEDAVINESGNFTITHNTSATDS